MSTSISTKAQTNNGTDKLTNQKTPRKARNLKRIAFDLLKQHRQTDGQNNVQM